MLEVFKSNRLQAYENEYWRLSGYERTISEDHQNYLLDKRALARRDGELSCEKE